MRRFGANRSGGRGTEDFVSAQPTSAQFFATLLTAQAVLSALSLLLLSCPILPTQGALSVQLPLRSMCGGPRTIGLGQRWPVLGQRWPIPGQHYRFQANVGRFAANVAGISEQLGLEHKLNFA